jgi:pimeloyl-ACP methyl ester carboxylesterase
MNVRATNGIHVPQADLDDLHERLARTRWPSDAPGAGYGFPLARLRELADHWQHGYDWRAQEAEFNEYPQFETEIDGQRVHFFHVRAQRPGALPLILTHGFPGSVAEFLDVIEPLRRDFHLVIPSIPGFGFSGPTHERGWDVHRVARAWAVLMARLGYDRYGAQGGDWGSAISRSLGAQDAGHVVGVHLSYLPMPAPEAGDAVLSAGDRARAEHIRTYVANQPAFRTMQATTPQSVGYLLTDSPVAQLAWIAERFADWSDPHTPVSDDRLLTDVMLYWLTRTAGSAARLHKESSYGALPCPVPIGVAVFAHDIVRAIRPYAESAYDIVHWSEFDRGGHFAPLEVPDVFAADVRGFFSGLGLA